MFSFIALIIAIATIITQEVNTKINVAAKQEEDLEVIFNDALLLQYTVIQPTHRPTILRQKLSKKLKTIIC